ncbi:hypothetical protein HKL94_02735 [Candidatus Parcubacteria bacterium]|nr:hypothetical protein [Candidatus Parcubacteria bacterium]
MTTSMSLIAELQLLGDRIPFIRDRRHTTFLPKEEHGRGKFIQDEWDALAALVECSDEGIDRVIVRQNAEEFVRVTIYTGSISRLTKRHLIPVPRAVVERLLHQGFIEETLRSSNGHTEQTELEPTESGMRALVAHIRSLQKQNKAP